MVVNQRTALIKGFKATEGVTRQDLLSQELREQIPDSPPAVVYMTPELIRDVIEGLQLIVEQVDRIFREYKNTPHFKFLHMVLGKWGTDYIEGFFGSARGRKAHHDGITMVDLLNNLKYLQHTGLVSHINRYFAADWC